MYYYNIAPSYLCELISRKENFVNTNHQQLIIQKNCKDCTNRFPERVFICDAGLSIQDFQDWENILCYCVVENEYSHVNKALTIYWVKYASGFVHTLTYLSKFYVSNQVKIM